MTTAEIVTILKYVDKDLLCPKCKGVLRDPVQTNCSHRFCYTCAQYLIKEEVKCPAGERCSIVVKEGIRKDNYAKKKINKEKVSCSFKTNGCTDEILVKDIENHEFNCSYRGSIAEKKDHEICSGISTGPVIDMEEESGMQDQEVCSGRSTDNATDMKEEFSMQDHEEISSRNSDPVTNIEISRRNSDPVTNIEISRRNSDPVTTMEEESSMQVCLTNSSIFTIKVNFAVIFTAT
ncbi:hypothetical protein KUTeg_013560 [Tegillarca granosa]|uniref:RING-type domain-containing protein n=1 Tax=Tegillarca granosa TaxID=220873 RepID=A0ABQ9EWH7_TEGGR|nr:hypothetical protein KUTeg_013560 [Tegillarca granosa]